MSITNDSNQGRLAQEAQLRRILEGVSGTVADDEGRIRREAILQQARLQSGLVDVTHFLARTGRVALCLCALLFSIRDNSSS